MTIATKLRAKGASGASYHLWAHPLGTKFSDRGGLYSLCGVNRQGRWVAYYIGMTDSGLNGRVGTGIWSHHKVRAAIALGATHVAAAAFDCGEAQLCRYENDLIQALQPPLNEIAPPRAASRFG